jgi:hypothetical protein
MPDEIDLTQDKDSINPDKFLYPQLMNYIKDYKAMFSENADAVEQQQEEPSPFMS